MARERENARRAAEALAGQLAERQAVKERLRKEDEVGQHACRRVRVGLGEGRLTDRTGMAGARWWLAGPREKAMAASCGVYVRDRGLLPRCCSRVRRRG